MNTVTKHLKEYEAKQDAKMLKLYNKAVRQAYDLGFIDGLCAGGGAGLVEVRRDFREYKKYLPELTK